MPRLRYERLAPYLLLAPCVVPLLVFVYLPIVENVRYSFFQWSSLNPTWTYIGFDNYRTLSHDPIFWMCLVNNVVYAVISLVFQVGLALFLAAILESTLTPALSSFFRVSLFIPSILPITVIGFLWQLLYQPAFGLIDQLLEAVGLESWARAWLGEEKTALLATVAVSQWQWTGYLTVLFVVAIRAIPKELYEAVQIDGGGRIRQFRHVTVPGVRETTLLIAIITIFGSIKVFDIVWVMTAGGPNNASEVLGTYMYRSAFRNDLVGYGATIAVVMFILAFVFGIVQISLQRERAAS
jgi:raffinose/stachyose/melibiose transport system permease protein